jgi:hypothetical protein
MIPETRNLATATATETGSTGSGSHVEAAAAMLGRIDQFVTDIPKFPFVSNPGRRLLTPASVPPEFIEQSNVAMSGEAALARPGVDPAQIRDLVSFSIAYGPVADAMEAAAATIRRSAAEARAKAGAEALTTYAIAQRLASRPDTSHLGTLVENMRRTLNLSPRFRARRAKKEAPPTTTPVTPTPVPATPPVTPVPHP